MKLPFCNEEESMKVRPVIIVVLFAAIVFMSAPALSQESTAESASGTALAEDQTNAQSAVQVQDTVVCQDIVDRAPVGSSDVFAKESDKLFCFARVVGASGDTRITHNWYYKGTLKSSVKLAVRSSNWRTWSSKTMSPDRTGEWMVEILSEDGTPLESIIFFVQ